MKETRTHVATDTEKKMSGENLQRVVVTVRCDYSLQSPRVSG